MFHRSRFSQTEPKNLKITIKKILFYITRSPTIDTNQNTCFVYNI